MSTRFEQIDWQRTPIGDLSLRRRLEPTLQVDVYEVKLGDEALMSSLFTASEIELANLALARLPGTVHGRVYEDAVAFDLVVQVLQAVAVAVDGELRDGPDHLAKEEHHRPHVEELEAKALVAALNDLQAAARACSASIS